MLILLLLLFSCQSSGGSSSTLASAVVEESRGMGDIISNIQESAKSADLLSAAKKLVGINKDGEEQDTLVDIKHNIVTIQPQTTDLSLLNIIFDNDCDDTKDSQEIYRWDENIRDFINKRCCPTRIYFLDDGHIYDIAQPKEEVTDIWKGERSPSLILDQNPEVLPVYAALYSGDILDAALEREDLSIILSLVETAHITKANQAIVRMFKISENLSGQKLDQALHIIELLIAQDADFDCCDFGNSPLVYAVVKAEYFNLFVSILEKGGDSILSKVAKNGMNIAHYAAFYGNEEAMKLIVAKDTTKKLNVEYKSSKPINIAQQKNHQALVDLMDNEDYN